MSEIAIRTDNLSRDFGTLRAVDGLDLEIPAGIIFGFLGPNGAGKTTTIRLLLGLLEQTKGRAEVLGFDNRTSSAEIRNASGALLEYSGLYDRLSAEDNLEFYARIWRMPSGQRRVRIRELLDNLGLWNRRREAVGTFSHGMRKRLAVARALLHHPSLVFLDEPTAGLDPMAAAALREDLSSLAASEGVTVFLNTHNLSEAERLCNLVGVIREGRLLAVGHPDELRMRSGAPRVEITGRGFDDGILNVLRGVPEVLGANLSEGRLTIDLRKETDIAPLVSMIVSAGAEVEEIRKERVSLEEVFLTLMEEER